MSKTAKVGAVYASIALMTIFLYMSARWYSYLTPRVTKEAYEEIIEKDDPILKRFKNKPKDGMVYSQSVEVTKTDSAGTFPFLANTKYDTVITIWSRPASYQYYKW